jgi:hypothetical protein
MDAALVALFWAIIALIGGMSGLALILGLGKGR